MSTCTFFGHRDCPEEIKPRLRAALIDLTENHDVDKFYVGQQGALDRIVRSVLKELVLIYPHIHYAVVLERMPQNRDEYYAQGHSDTILPEGIETVPPRFAIDHRNRWMLQHSEYVVTYVRYSTGGAAKFAKEAKRTRKLVVEI